MTQFIRHRINRIAELGDVNPDCGVEIDLRSDVAAEGTLHLSHEPWKRGDDFTAWLTAFKARKIAGPLILNTKEDGLEERVMEVLSQEGIDHYFFLDTALPTLVRLTSGGRHRKFAVRLSSFEGVEGVRRFQSLVDWVWVDCFGGKPLPADSVAELKGAFRLCLVSPELQGQPVDAIGGFAELGRLSDAICTKRPDLWRL